MVTQSRAKPVPLLLTRPETQGARFADDLRARFGDQIRIVKTPLMAPRFFVPTLPDGPFAALIITSQTGVEAYSRLGDAMKLLPTQIFCVGERTAKAVRKAALQPVLIGANASSLIDQIKALQPVGRLLHLRGRDARGDIADGLNSAGIETFEAITYVQAEQPLAAEAAALLKAKFPVLVPLFSPRTAALFAAELRRITVISPLFIAAISDEVALEAGGSATQIEVAAKPDAASMLDALARLFADIRRA